MAPRESVTKVVCEKAFLTEVAGCAVNCWCGEQNYHDNQGRKKEERWLRLKSDKRNHRMDSLELL